MIDLRRPSPQPAACSWIADPPKPMVERNLPAHARRWSSFKFLPLFTFRWITA
jgi:hypothetical protein